MASILDYKQSLKISSEDPSFAALIWAAIRKADSDNLERLREVFPELYEEFLDRYNSPGGALRASEFKWLETHDEEE